MTTFHFPSFMTPRDGLANRWRLWAFFAAMALAASAGTWLAGQYQIGRLDSLKDRYDQPVANYAKVYGNALSNSLERDLLEGCKQAQIGSWLQTTDALRFDGPLTGNRIDVRLDPGKAYLDLNPRETADCVQDEIEDRQYDIGSMTTTWALILFLLSFCLTGWTWLCYQGVVTARKTRNIYAETLADGVEEIPDETVSSSTEETMTSSTDNSITSPDKQRD